MAQGSAAHRRATRQQLRASGSHPSLASSRSAPLDTLERDEILRTRWFLYASFALQVSTSAALRWLGGDPAVTRWLRVALLGAALATAFLLYRARDPARFRRPTTDLAWLVHGLGSAAIVPFFGAFSPAPVVLVIAIFFTGLGRSPRVAYATYVLCAGTQGVVALLTIAGVTRDTGLITALQLNHHQQVAAQCLVQVVFAMTLFIARMSRRAQLTAIAELEREVRTSAHREALLIEAREQLERALRPGRGRFTDQQIGGYQLGSVLGRGAMGEVYEATGQSGPVAIKVLSQASLGNANHVLRFFRELQTASAVEAPNVVKVLEVGKDPVPYLVMERLEGKTLAAILRTRRVLPAAEVIELIRQVGAGITAAGAAGVVHRDLKPQNVLQHGATWKILDFGVARALHHSDTLTAGQIVGTPSYMAPEQARGGAVDHATDLYALAAIAYRALTGHPPFVPGEMADTLYRVVHTAPRRPSALVPDLPHSVDRVFAIALAKQPEARFPTASALVEALAGALADPPEPRGRRRPPTGDDVTVS